MSNSKVTFPRFFNVFGTAGTREGKRALRKLATALSSALNKKVRISWNPEVGEEVKDGVIVKAAGWAVLVECTNKVDAQLIRNKFWSDPVAAEVSPFRIVKLPQHAKNFIFDAEKDDHTAFAKDNLGLEIVETKEEVKLKPKSKKQKSKKPVQDEPAKAKQPIKKAA